MEVAMKKAVVVSIVSICLLAAACGYFFPTKIGDILKNPREYAGKEVTVSGEVKEVLALIVFKSFVLKDETGEIAVITSRTLPAVGQKLKVTGTVKEAFSLGTRNLLVIREKGTPE
jgi:hypothetical protein